MRIREEAQSSRQEATLACDTSYAPRAVQIPGGGCKGAHWKDFSESPHDHQDYYEVSCGKNCYHSNHLHRRPPRGYSSTHLVPIRPYRSSRALRLTCEALRSVLCSSLSQRTRNTEICGQIFRRTNLVYLRFEFDSDKGLRKAMRSFAYCIWFPLVVNSLAKYIVES